MDAGPAIPAHEGKTKSQRVSHSRNVNSLNQQSTNQNHPTRRNGGVNKDEWILKNTGNLLESIVVGEVKPRPSPVGSESGFESVCSYSWSSVSGSTIYVPGSPPKFTPPPMPVALQKDDGSHSKLHFGSRKLYTAYVPLLKSLEATNPTFDLGNADLLAHRNSLRKLFNAAAGRVYESFRIDAQIIGNTLVLIRRERDMGMILYGSRGTGYGRNFEAAFTTPEIGLEAGVGHHRVIRYPLGDLSCVVQFEVDAWYDSATAEDASTDVDNIELPQSPETAEDDDLPPLKALSISPGTLPKQKKGSKANDRLTVENLGQDVDVSKLVEIKTAKNLQNKNGRDRFAQLWFGRTPYLITGMHQNGDGVFNKIDIAHMQDSFQRKEMQYQQDFRKLVALIAELRKITRQAKGGRCVIACNHKRKPLQLEVFEDESKTGCIIPRNFKDMFWGRSEDKS